MAFPQPARRPRGSALFIVLGIVFLLALFSTTMIQMAFTENLGTDVLILDGQAQYLAESAAEYAIRQLKTAVANNYTLSAGVNTVVLNGCLPGYTVPNTAVPYVQYKVVRMEASATRTSTDADGTTHTYQLYAVSGRAWVPDPWNPKQFSEVYINKMVDLDYVPLFQYLAFYNQFTLEFLPGNDATVKGRIHSNRDLYIGAEAGKTLTVNTYSMKCCGTLQRHRDDSTTSAGNYYMTGTVQVKRKDVADTATVNSTNYPPLEARGALKVPNGTLVPTSVAPSGYDSNFLGYDGNNDGKISGATDLASFANGVQGRFAGSIQTGADGVPTLEAPTDIRAFRPPVPGETANYKFNTTTKLWEPATGAAATSVKGFYQQQAALVLVSNGAKTQLIKNDTGTVLIEMNSGTVTTNVLKDASNKSVNPLSEKQMFDGREYDATQDADTQGMVKVTELDVGKLNTALYSGSPIYPTTGAGSVIYAYRTDTTAEDPNGIRLTNGAALNNKLTFVSEDPVYVKGDFNSTTKDTYGAVIIADAVSLLSNQWNDSKTKSSGLPAPTGNLEFDAAVMCGAYATQQPDASGNGGNYNGGFENLPRFHEDWSGAGKTVTINGSFASLFTSTYAKGKWVYGGSCYTAPVRNWNFNSKFLNPSYQPPGFPFSVGQSRVVWWRGRNMTWWP